VSLSRHLLFAGCLGAPIVAQAVEGPPEVADVALDGARRVHAERVLGQLLTKPGDPLDPEALAEDVRRIENMGPFANATAVSEPVGQDRVRVIFRVQELPYIADLRIEGVGFWARRSLRKKVNLKRGDHLNPLLLEHNRRALEAHLRQQNYLRAEVSTRTEIDEATGIGTVVFDVDLGRQVEVGMTHYDGLPDAVHEYFLDQHLINRPGSAFQTEMVELHDVGAVTEYLRDQGYLDARVTRHKVDFFDNVPAWQERSRHGPQVVPEGQRRNRVVLSFWIDAGQRYELGSVRFVDQSVVSEEQLRETFRLPEGHPFVRRDLEAAKDRALALVRNRGYAQAQLIEDVVAHPDEHRVDLVLHMREGDRYRIGRIDIDGNTVTKDAVVRRALRLQPGELWNDEGRDESVRQIRRTGLFETGPFRPLRIRPVFEEERDVPDEDDMKEVDVVVQLDEASTGRFNFDVGFSSAVGIVGRVSFSERNFDLWGLLTGNGWRGAQHRLNTSASWSDERTELDLSWSNPHLMDSAWSFDTSFSRSDSSSLDWDELRLRSSAGIGRTFLDNDLRLKLSYSYVDLEIDDIESDANERALDGAGDYYFNSLSLSQSYDVLDHPVFPTSGFRVQLNETLNGDFLSASEDYYELSAQADAFIPLAKSQLEGVTFVHVGQRFRYLEAIGDGAVPFFDRLYGGGPMPRHRGFERFDLGPFETNRNGLDARVGGTAELLTTVELSVPIQGVNSGLRGVLFTDIGQVWDAENDSIDLGDLRTAAGVGLRFPQAFPIALDFAWLLDREDDEDSFQFHFTLAGFVF